MSAIGAHSTGSSVPAGDSPIHRPNGAAGSANFAVLQNPNLTGPTSSAGSLRSRAVVSGWSSVGAVQRSFGKLGPLGSGRTALLIAMASGDMDLLT